MPILLPLKVHSQVKVASEGNQKLLKQKGISVTVKPTYWIEAVEVLYTAGHQGKMQSIV